MLTFGQLSLVRKKCGLLEFRCLLALCLFSGRCSPSPALLLLYHYNRCEVWVLGFGETHGFASFRALVFWVSAEDNQYKLLARAGRQVQGVYLTTSLDQEGIKKAVQRVPCRVP
nr:uncharacterized protein LOC127291829 [Lolium perenne]